MRRTTIPACLLATLATGCSSTTTPAAAPASPVVTVSATPSTAPTDAPSTTECTQFAQVYNQQVGPALKVPAAGAGNVFWMTQADAFRALIGVLAPGADPYSQTLAHDATAVEASDRAYDADGTGYGLLGTFNTDLQVFLKQCGYSGNNGS